MPKPPKEVRESFAKRVRTLASRGRVVLRHHARVQMRNRGIYFRARRR